MAGKKLQWGKEYNWVDTHADPLGYDPDQMPALTPGEFSASFNGIPEARKWAKQISDVTTMRQIAFQSTDPNLQLEELKRLKDVVSEMQCHVRDLNRTISSAKKSDVRLSSQLWVIRTSRFGAACSTLQEAVALRDLFRVGVKNAQTLISALTVEPPEAQA